MGTTAGMVDGSGITGMPSNSPGSTGGVSRGNFSTGPSYNPIDNEYAYLGMKIPISNANVCGTGRMLNEPIKYTANTGLAAISTANANLDGTGTVATLLTASGSGLLVKSITIKATANTTRGMVRIFFKAGASFWLLHEVPVYAVTQGSVDHSFIAVINEPFYLKSGDLLVVSTEKADSFIVTGEGLDIAYPF